ncbi:E3 ubiquitin-protein ligase MARCHF3-like [Dermacentor albipictus]|uniref:E3 ubiquitin-protein ligase MARCHF3-like n=1 Tax=Dermacentor albipictus TaxID=60249 RepID=UPI0038FD0FB4
MVSELPELTPPENLSENSADSKVQSCSNGDICRICFCGVSTESLLAPCKCKGSLAKVHKTCLETWLGNQAIDQCEICKYHYMTARRPKGFHEWLMNSSTREDKQNLVGDMVALLLLTPLVVFSLWLCTEGAIQFSHEGFPTWESAGLVFITIVLFVVFCVWVTLLYRYHYTIWKQWRSHNFHVNLLVKTNASMGDDLPAAAMAQVAEPEALPSGDIDDGLSAVVVEEPPELDAAEEGATDKAESPPCTPSKESPPKSTSSTLIIYTPAV